MLISIADQWGPCSLTTLSQRANLSAGDVLARLEQLTAAGQMVTLGDLAGENDAVAYSRSGWEGVKAKLKASLQGYHHQYPLRQGAPTQEIRSRLGLSQGVYLRVIDRVSAEGEVVDDGQVLKLPEHQPTLTGEQEQAAGRFVSELERDPYSPPTDFAIEGELLNALVDQGRVVKVSASVVFASGAYQDMLGGSPPT